MSSRFRLRLSRLLFSGSPWLLSLNGILLHLRLLRGSWLLPDRSLSFSFFGGCHGDQAE
ncbi:hypothetical protein OIU78_029027 [Salix suchowensis]|nr:hypothetical protein OIU78_029027 [Salix suchowensis]